MTTDAPRDRNELLRRQREGRAAWQALLSRVPLNRFEEAGVSGELGVKDIVAHLAAWERRATSQLRRRMLGKREEIPPSMSWREFEHAFNQQVSTDWGDRSWADVQQEAAEAHTAFMAEAEATPDAILFDAEEPAWQLVAFNGYLHYLDFANDIRRWLGIR